MAVNVQNPGWSVVSAGAGSGPQIPKPMDPQVYAEWFAWARHHVTDPSQCHAAAYAATRLVQAGATPQQAAAAAQRAATDPGVASRPLAGDGLLHRYTSWFAWATFELKLDAVRAHQAAEAAMTAAARGLDPAHSAAIAQQVVGLQPTYRAATAQPSKLSFDALYHDPGGQALFIGIVCLAVALLFDFHFAFAILPISGIWRGVKGLSGPFKAYSAAGILLCLVAGLIRWVVIPILQAH